MARYSKGILGEFSGGVGAVVGSNWKGISYMRSKSSKRSNRSSQAQLEQQAKFGLAIQFVQPLVGLLTTSFKSFAVKMSGFNNALSWLLKNAVKGVYPAFSIDYGLVLVSRGALPNVLSPDATAQAGSKVKFTWADNSGTGKAKATDKALLVLYCPAFKQALYTTGSAARSIGTETLDATPFKGQVVESYIGFISPDGEEVANSIYTGSITIT